MKPGSLVCVEKGFRTYTRYVLPSHMFAYRLNTLPIKDDEIGIIVSYVVPDNGFSDVAYVLTPKVPLWTCTDNLDEMSSP
jgi:hypothetical protein